MVREKVQGKAEIVGTRHPRGFRHERPSEGRGGPLTNLGRKIDFRQKAHTGKDRRVADKRSSSLIDLYPYGMGKPRDDRNTAQNLSRELADLAAQLASLKGKANAWLSGESYDALRHRLEDAHKTVEAAAVEARRRMRLNVGRER